MHPIAAAGLLIFCLWVLPILLAVLRFRLIGAVAWHTADRSSAGLLPSPADPTARIRILAARTVSWRGVLAHHCWIVIKPYAAPAYTRYDYTAWGHQPIRRNGFDPDGRWFGAPPHIVHAVDGPAAQAMIAPIELCIRDYAWRRPGDYRAFPGPNSNSFIAGIIDAVPGLHAVLPPTAIGKDFPTDGRACRLTRTGLRLSLNGLLGLRLGWIEGLEINLLGAVAGLDWRRPALKLPAIGRIGWPARLSPRESAPAPARRSAPARPEKPARTQPS